MLIMKMGPRTRRIKTEVADDDVIFVNTEDAEVDEDATVKRQIF